MVGPQRLMVGPVPQCSYATEAVLWKKLTTQVLSDIGLEASCINEVVVICEVLKGIRSYI